MFSWCLVFGLSFLVLFLRVRSCFLFSRLLGGRSRAEQDDAFTRPTAVVNVVDVGFLSGGRMPLLTGSTEKFAFLVRRRLPSPLMTSSMVVGLISRRCALSVALPTFTCRLQKDQRPALGSHAVQCVLVGYPTDYKGWKF